MTLTTTCGLGTKGTTMRCKACNVPLTPQELEHIDRYGNHSDLCYDCSRASTDGEDEFELSEDEAEVIPANVSKEIRDWLKKFE